MRTLNKMKTTIETLKRTLNMMKKVTAETCNSELPDQNFYKPKSHPHINNKKVEINEKKGKRIKNTKDGVHEEF
jgi:hypothetical protein